MKAGHEKTITVLIISVLLVIAAALYLTYQSVEQFNPGLVTSQAVVALEHQSKGITGLNQLGLLRAYLGTLGSGAVQQHPEIIQSVQLAISHLFRLTLLIFVAAFFLVLILGFWAMRLISSDARRVVRELSQSEQYVQSLFHAVSSMLVVIDERLNIQRINRAVTEGLGYTEQELVGGHIEGLFPNRRLPATVARQIVDKNELLNYEALFVTKERTEVPVLFSASVVPGASGGIICVAQDITKQKITEMDLNYMAHHDGLTGLPNRTAFEKSCQNEIARAKRHKRQFALLFIDLDEFKSVNDTQGHPAGDILLKEIAKRLRTSLRTEDLVARTGGDEFAVVLTDLKDGSNVGAITQKLIDALNVPVSLMEATVCVTASIGIAGYPFDGSDVATLFRQADGAMYRAKQQGKNRYCLSL